MSTTIIVRAFPSLPRACSRASEAAPTFFGSTSLAARRSSRSIVRRSTSAFRSTKARRFFRNTSSRRLLLLGRELQPFDDGGPFPPFPARHLEHLGRGRNRREGHQGERGEGPARLHLITSGRSASYDSSSGKDAVDRAKKLVVLAIGRGKLGRAIRWNGRHRRDARRRPGLGPAPKDGEAGHEREGGREAPEGQRRPVEDRPGETRRERRRPFFRLDGGQLGDAPQDGPPLGGPEIARERLDDARHGPSIEKERLPQLRDPLLALGADRLVNRNRRGPFLDRENPAHDLFLRQMPAAHRRSSSFWRSLRAARNRCDLTVPSSSPVAAPISAIDRSS